LGAVRLKKARSAPICFVNEDDWMMIMYAMKSAPVKSLSSRTKLKFYEVTLVELNPNFLL
jgi:hypothetical protein